MPGAFNVPDKPIQNFGPTVVSEIRSFHDEDVRQEILKKAVDDRSPVLQDVDQFDFPRNRLYAEVFENSVFKNRIPDVPCAGIDCKNSSFVFSFHNLFTGPGDLLFSGIKLIQANSSDPHSLKHSDQIRIFILLFLLKLIQKKGISGDNFFHQEAFVLAFL